MSDSKRREAPSSPSNYDINTNSVVIEMDLMYEQGRAIARGDYISGAFIGPAGIGKSFVAELAIADEGAILVPLRADANTFMDDMHKHRHRNKVCLWDDTNYVYNSTPLLNLLNFAIVPQGIRRMVDKRPGGHGIFPIFNRHIFLANKPLFDPGLLAFEARQRTDIEAFRSRFDTISEVGYLPNHRDQATEAIWHYACWVCTDGAHKLRDMSDARGNFLSREKSNEVLRWWAANYHLLADHSPRELQIIAGNRLKSPNIWQPMAERRLLREPWCHPDGRRAQAIMEPWEIKPTGRPHKVKKHQSAVVEPVPVVEPEVAPEIAPEVAPEIAPEVAPEIAPEVAPEIAPENSRRVRKPSPQMHRVIEVLRDGPLTWDALVHATGIEGGRLNSTVKALVEIRDAIEIDDDGMYRLKGGNE